jgi:hypothetical protein
MDERALHQYYEDLYITFLGSYLKNGHALNPGDIIKVTDTHYKALVKRLKFLGVEEI